MNRPAGRRLRENDVGTLRASADRQRVAARKQGDLGGVNRVVGDAVGIVDGQFARVHEYAEILVGDAYEPDLEIALLAVNVLDVRPARQGQGILRAVAPVDPED